MTDVRKKSARGFASMSPERVREIASQGGKAAHVKGTAHEFTADEAREAGAKGGKAVAEERGAGHMAAIGRKGGRARGAMLRRKRDSHPPVNTLPPPSADN